MPGKSMDLISALLLHWLQTPNIPPEYSLASCCLARLTSFSFSPFSMVEGEKQPLQMAYNSEKDKQRERERESTMR